MLPHARDATKREQEAGSERKARVEEFGASLQEWPEGAGAFEEPGARPPEEP